jgi:hydroxypyruvate isomerase
MPTLSVCIEMFWRDAPAEERIRRAAKLGFEAFEFWGWKNKDIDAVRKAADETGLKLACCSMEPNGALVHRARRQEVIAGFAESVEAFRKLGTKRAIVTTGNALADESFAVTRRRVVSTLRELAKPAEDAGITIVLEPLNTLVDHAGYWLARMPDAVDIVDEVDSPAVKILMDIYHQQVMEGNIIANLRRYMDRIGHFHTAGVPGRTELVGGELDYGAIFRAIDEAEYDGFVGLEFRATMEPEESLSQALSLVN